MRTNRDELFTFLKQGTVVEGLKHNYCASEEWKLNIKNSAYLSWQQAELLCDEHKCDKTNNLSNITWDIHKKSQMD
jgi:hypothetical protein